VLSRREELGRLPQGPKVVLATLPTLGAGPAQQLVLEWAGDPRNAVIFTQQPEVRAVPACRGRPAAAFC